jgi:hypothetical protein
VTRLVLAALDRQVGVLIALAVLAVAAGAVSWGAWALLRRERRDTSGHSDGEREDG